MPHVIEDPVWDIDIAIFDTRTAIEVDGPNHFTRNTQRPLGRTTLKHKLLSAAGWNVIHIPFNEFNRIPKVGWDLAIFFL